MRKHILALLVALMAVGLTGCGDSKDFNSISGQQGDPVRPAPTPTVTPTTTPTPSNEAFVRVAHLASAQTNLDVLLNGEQVLTNKSTAEATEYLEVEPGEIRVQVRATGTTTDLVDQTRTVAVNSYNTFVVVGNNIPWPAQQVDSLSLLTLVDNVTPSNNRINIRFAHIVNDEFYNDAILGIPGGQDLAGPVSFGETTGYQDFSPAANETSVEVRGGVGDDTFSFIYSTSASGNNKNIVETLLEALGGQVGNVTAFFGFAGPNSSPLLYPGYVIIDRPNNASEVYIFNPEVNT